MANLGENYNVNDLPEQEDFEAIPAGEYMVKIVESELKDTKSGNGKYIKLRLDILGPSYQGRVLFSNINIRNANPKAEEIGRKELGSLLRAIGLASLTDTVQLIGGDLIVKVNKTEDDYNGGFKNEVKRYKAISSESGPKAFKADKKENVNDEKNKMPWGR